MAKKEQDPIDVIDSGVVHLFAGSRCRIWRAGPDRYAVREVGRGHTTQYYDREDVARLCDYLIDTTYWYNAEE